MTLLCAKDFIDNEIEEKRKTLKIYDNEDNSLFEKEINDLCTEIEDYTKLSNWLFELNQYRDMIDNMKTDIQNNANPNWSTDMIIGYTIAVEIMQNNLNNFGIPTS